MVLLAFGCMVLVDDDVDTGAKTTLTALLLCLAHVACCGAALALVQGSSVHGGAACDTKVRGSGAAALAVAMGCSALTLLLFFPCFCGPCAVCLEGGSDEEKEKRAGKEGICATICACTMAVSIAVATVVGIVYSSVRAVASKLWLVLWPHQKKLLGFVPATLEERVRCSRITFLSSRSNTILSFPLLFLMASGGHGLHLF